MKIECKAKNEDGSIIFEGSLNQIEISFLLQYAVNSLMTHGAVFNLQGDPAKEEEFRIKLPEGVTLQ